MDTPTTTRGIASAQGGSLAVLQHTPNGYLPPNDDVDNAALDIASYHAPKGDQAERHRALSLALAAFLSEMVRICPPGPERSTAISRAREAKFWASAAVALE